MSLKRFLLALTAMAMLAAVVASSASAAAETKPSKWYVNGAALAEGKANGKAVECSVPEGTTIAMHGEVGSVAPKTKVTLTATGVECLESSIFNEGGAAKDTGRLRFTGVTFDEPSNCVVENHEVVTGLLSTELYMDSANPAITFDKFEPDTEVVNFATVHITKENECAISGNKVAKGFVYGQAENLTGVEAATQPLTFGTSVEETAGNGLVFAGNPAHLTGTVKNALSSAEKFGANEK